MPASLKPTSDTRFEAPPHEIKGKTKVDQVWIDKTVGVGQEVLGWHVAPRPPGLDVKPPAATRAAALAKPAATPKRRSLIKRLLTLRPKPEAPPPMPIVPAAPPPAKWPGS